MKALTVGEVKTHFSELLGLVRKGERIQILYGKAKRPVAMLVPLEEVKGERELGFMEGKATFQIQGDGKISEEEFLGL
jgi:antitoxin (DNA-binding transcriptional repressor) of toxin-antitoxin stability system